MPLRFINAITLTMLLVAALLPSNASAGAFVHPAKTFSIDTPFAWRTLTSIDGAGRMHHVFTPQWTGDPDKVDRGIWVFTIPIPNDNALTAETACVAAAAYLKSTNPSITINPSVRTEEKLGDKLNAWAMAGEGKLASGGGWKGVVRVSFTSDNLIIIASGGPPKESDGVVKDAEKTLAKFACPLPLKPWNEATAPKSPPQRLRDVADTLRKCTMMLRVLAPDPKDPSKYISLGSGTGFFVHPDGYIITNRHVVERSDARSPRRPYDPLLVTFDQTVRRDELLADVIAISHQWDVALLKIRGDEKWPFLRMCDFAKVDIGDEMALIGWPKPNEVDQVNISLNTGTVSRIERDAQLRARMLVCGSQTAQGNSGGPIYDLELGGIIGVLFRGISVESHGVTDFIYIGAVPMDKVLWEFPQLMEVDAEKPREMNDKERHALIRYYLDQQRYGAAMLECKRALAVRPADGVAHAFMYRIYSLHADAPRAEAALALARADAAAEYETALMVGLTAVDAGDAGTARQMGDTAVRLRPRSIDAHLLQAYALGLTLDQNTEAKFSEVIQLAGGAHGEASAMLGVMPIRRWLSTNALLIRDPSFKIPANTVQEARKHLAESLRVQPYGNGLAHSHLCMLAGFYGDDAQLGPAARAAFSAAALDPETSFVIGYHDLTMANLSAIGVDGTIKASYRSLAQRDSRYGAFVAGFANLRGWLILRSATDPKAQQEAKYYHSEAQRLLNISVAGGESLWWRPMSLRLLDVSRQGTTPQTNPTPNPNVRPLPQPVARDPAAGINTVQQQHGVVFNGRQGLVFHIDVDLAFATNQECAIVVVVRDSLDNPLKGVTKEFTLADGVMGAHAVVKPGGDYVRGHKVKIFIPYDDIHKASNGSELQYSVAVYNMTSKKWINGNRHTQKLFIPPPRQLEAKRDEGLVAKVAAVTPKYDVEKNGKKGMVFLVDCSVFSAKGKEATLGFHFLDLRGRGEIAARSKEYSDAKGLAFASVKLKPDDERFFAKNIEVFIPYEELGIGTDPTYMMYRASISVGGHLLTEDQYDQAIQGLLYINDTDPRRNPRRAADPRDHETPENPYDRVARPDRRNPGTTTPTTPTTPEQPARRKFISARINEVKAVGGVEKDGKKGVMVYVSMGVFDAAGSKVEVGVNFSDNRNRPIAAKNAAWSDSRGLLYASTTFDVKDDKFFPEGLEVFIPYSELVPAAGKHQIRYSVLATRDGRQLANGPRNTIELVVEEKDFK